MRLSVGELRSMGYDEHGNRLGKPLAEVLGGMAPVRLREFEREKDLHEYVMRRCRDRGYYVLHSRMDWRTSLAVGAPDFVIACAGGRTVYLECKTAKGKLSKEQQAHIAWLRHLGHDVRVVRSVEEVDAALVYGGG